MKADEEDGTRAFKDVVARTVEGEMPGPEPEMGGGGVSGGGARLRR